MKFRGNHGGRGSVLQALRDIVRAVVVRSAHYAFEGFTALGVASTPGACAEARQEVEELKARWLSAECIRQAESIVGHEASAP